MASICNVLAMVNALVCLHASNRELLVHCNPNVLLVMCSACKRWQHGCLIQKHFFPSGFQVVRSLPAKAELPQVDKCKMTIFMHLEGKGLLL